MSTFQTQIQEVPAHESDSLSFYVINLNSSTVVITSSKAVFLNNQVMQKFVNDTMTNLIYDQNYSFYTDSCSFQFKNGGLSVSWDNKIDSVISYSTTFMMRHMRLLGSFIVI
jgi:hypothetical protein